jgi:hypothetical protein
MKISSPKAINWTLKQYGYTQEANSGIAELGAKISCAASLLTANRLLDSI